MKQTASFLVIGLIAFMLLPFVTSLPNLEEYRPEELEKGKEIEGGITIFKSVLVLTLGLVILKFFKLRLSWIIDFSTFFSGYVLGNMFGFGIPLGLLILSLRKIKTKFTFNLASAMTIICFTLILSPFITHESSMLLLALLSFYDVIGVLYFPYIKFLWLQTSNEKIYDTIAIIYENGMVGAGDFALPLIFALSYGTMGIVALLFLALGFSLNQSLAKRLGAFPGIPFQALFAFLFYLIAA